MGTQNVRLELDVPREDGRGWRRTHSFTETQEDDLLNAQWCKDIQKGASHLLEETWVNPKEGNNLSRFAGVCNQEVPLGIRIFTKENV